MGIWDALVEDFGEMLVDPDEETPTHSTAFIEPEKEGTMSPLDFCPKCHSLESCCTCSITSLLVRDSGSALWPHTAIPSLSPLGGSAGSCLASVSGGTSIDCLRTRGVLDVPLGGGLRQRTEWTYERVTIERWRKTVSYYWDD